MKAAPLPAIGLGLALAACNPGTPLHGGELVLLRWGHLDARPLGLMTGQLSFAGGCVGVEGVPGQRSVVLWPPDTRFDRSTGALRVLVEGRAFNEGDPLRLGGGGYSDQAWMRQLVGPVPAACEADQYILATGLAGDGDPP
jgi:hypothetical protein